LELELNQRKQTYEMIENASSPVEYMSSLEKYISEFPDDLLSKSIVKSNLISSEEYNSFLSIWDKQAAYIKELESGSKENWTKIRDDISNLGSDALLTDLHFYLEKSVVSKSYILTFIKGKLDAKQGTIAGYDDKFTALAYTPVSFNKQSRFRSRSVNGVAKDSLYTLKHCDIVNSMVGQLYDVEAEDSIWFVLKYIAELAATPTWDEMDITRLNRADADFLKSSIVNSFLKINLIKFLSERAIEIVGESTFPELDEAVAEMNKEVKNKLDWLCVVNPEVQLMNKKYESILNKHFSDDNKMFKKMHFQSLVQSVAVKRGVEWIGTAGFYNANSIRWKNRHTRPREIWVYRLDEYGNRKLYIAIRRNKGEKYRVCMQLLPGEPLLAAKDSSLTTDVMKDIADKVELDDTDNVLSWLPVNWPLKGNDN
jgi:hypothetical protein